MNYYNVILIIRFSYHYTFAYIHIIFYTRIIPQLSLFLALILPLRYWNLLFKVEHIRHCCLFPYPFRFCFSLRTTPSSRQTWRPQVTVVDEPEVPKLSIIAMLLDGDCFFTHSRCTYLSSLSSGVSWDVGFSVGGVLFLDAGLFYCLSKNMLVFMQHCFIAVVLRL